MTVDPVRGGANWYQYVSGDPVNLWDPLGLDVIVLNDSEAVDYIPEGPCGHNAALIGNEEDGWDYYSKDGSDKPALYVRPVSVSIPTLSVYATVPNIQYENVLNIANVIVENGVVIREESSDICKE